MIDISSSNYTITNTIYPRRQEKYTYSTKNINNIDAPTATNDVINIDEAGTYVSSIVSGLLSNDVDVDGDMLSLIVENEPMHGILTVNEDQSISYVHDGSETTSDFFNYDGARILINRNV